MRLSVRVGNGLFGGRKPPHEMIPPAGLFPGTQPGIQIISVGRVDLPEPLDVRRGLSPPPLRRSPGDSVQTAAGVECSIGIWLPIRHEVLPRLRPGQTLRFSVPGDTIIQDCLWTSRPCVLLLLTPDTSGEGKGTIKHFRDNFRYISWMITRRIGRSG